MTDVKFCPALGKVQARAGWLCPSPILQESFAFNKSTPQPNKLKNPLLHLRDSFPDLRIWRDQDAGEHQVCKCTLAIPELWEAEGGFQVLAQPEQLGD